MRRMAIGGVGGYAVGVVAKTMQGAALRVGAAILVLTQIVPHFVEDDFFQDSPIRIEIDSKKLANVFGSDASHLLDSNGDGQINIDDVEDGFRKLWLRVKPFIQRFPHTAAGFVAGFMAAYT